MTYAELLKHPLWQRKRLERLQAADWKCTDCGDGESELHVHHDRYIAGRMPWEYDDELLVVVCHVCHARRHGRETIRRSRVCESAANLIDRAVWLMLHHSELWARLDRASHDLLIGQPHPYDLLFGCIERSVLEHGPLAAIALLDDLRDQTRNRDGQVVLARVAAFHRPGMDCDADQECADLLDRLRLHAVEEELKVLFESGSAQSTDCQSRGRELLAMQARLKRKTDLSRRSVA